MATARMPKTRPVELDETERAILDAIRSRGHISLDDLLGILSKRHATVRVQSALRYLVASGFVLLSPKWSLRLPT